jgi:hypothetical protein
MEEQKKIFVYRIGEELFCPECYERAENSLPEDSGVNIPGKPLTVEDIKVYTCGKCKVTKGGKDLSDLSDVIEDCVCKISLIGDFFSHNIPDDELFSKKGTSGLYFILRDIKDDLNLVVDEMSEKRRMGLIKEVK